MKIQSDITVTNDEQTLRNEQPDEKTLTWSEFLDEVTEIEKASNELNDGWTIQGKVGEPADPGSIYLRKVTSLSLKGFVSATCVDFEENLLEQEDVAERRSEVIREVASLEYHLLYSLSYQVPIIYFNAWRPNGTLLGIEEIWALACPTHSEALHEARWGAISQQDHPILGTPYFFFHPCNSAQLLAKVARDDCANKVIAWLSVVAPLVGLKLSIEYIKSIENLRLTNNKTKYAV
jgi:ubiquitin-like-conjugating enzyme ATG10